MSDEPLPTYENLFKFLFSQDNDWPKVVPGASVKYVQPRFQLHPPDLLELRWSVFDRATTRTIAYGLTPEEAANVAMGVAWRDKIFARPDVGS